MHDHAVVLRAGRTWESPPIPLHDGVGRLVARLTAVHDARIRSTLLVTLNGIEYRATGQVTDRDSYSLVYTLPAMLADHAHEYLKTARRGGDGRAYGTPLTRLAEMGRATARLVLEHLDGDPLETLARFSALVLPRPLVMHKNSVAFDAASSASENNGDGVLSLSHTCSGSNRAAFMGTTNNDASTGKTTTSISYGGSGGTEMWDLSSNIVAGSGYYIVAPATGSQTVTATLSGTTLDHILGVISMTGVDQSTPIGTPATATGNSTTPSATVSSPASDSLICDCMACDNFGSNAAGANQTERWNVQGGYVGSENGGSTQSGADGGAMTWTVTGGNWLIGAVEFKASGGSPATYNATGSEGAAESGTPSLQYGPGKIHVIRW